MLYLSLVGGVLFLLFAIKHPWLVTQSPSGLPPSIASRRNFLLVCAVLVAAGLLSGLYVGY